MPGTLDTSTNSNSSRKSLIERLASLRIQSTNTAANAKSSSSSTVKAPESPRYIPRSTQSATTTTKSKFYNYPQPQQQNSQDSNDLLSSPTISRRRKLTGISSKSSANSASSVNIATSNNHSPFDSPKYFPKQKFIEAEEKISKFPETSKLVEANENLSEISDISEIERNRNSVMEVVTSFIDSFTVLNNFLTKSSNSTSAKLHLQNMNTSFAALQMDLKAAVSQLSNLKNEISNLNDEISYLKNENNEIKKKSDNNEINQELEEQLRIALNQITEIKSAFEKEKGNVEFLQNYMEEIIQLKDEAEQKILTLEKELNTTGTVQSTKSESDLLKENENLKETIKLLEMERLSSKNVCEQAIQVLDSAAGNGNLEELKQELKVKQAEIEKLKGREKHFKESNEIFQQKLILLTEENRKLRGQRPLNHY